jgi:hypothetical protein
MPSPFGGFLLACVLRLRDTSAVWGKCEGEVMNEGGHRGEIDPDFFDVLLRSLSVLSNVATMASTWIVLNPA